MALAPHLLLYVVSDGEWSVSAYSLKGFDSLISFCQTASDGRHASRRSWSAVQRDQKRASSSMFANEYHRPVFLILFGTQQ
jgi:hypothetical protein